MNGVENAKMSWSCRVKGKDVRTKAKLSAVTKRLFNNGMERSVVYA